jgi:hypothetical protein
MANQVAARLAGDDYQHLLAWHEMLSLRMPRHRVREVVVEDPDGAHVDDVTTLYDPAAGRPDVFEQVKYHIDQRGQYSTDFLLERATPASRSLLEKFFVTWRKLSADAASGIVLRLTSNWSWDGTDHVRSCIQGKDTALSPEFFTAGPKQKIGKVRERWRTHLGATPDEFDAFARTLRFRVGFDCFDQVVERVAERMEHLDLKYDEAALVVAVGIVRELIKSGDSRVDAPKLQNLLERYDLFRPKEDAPSTVIYLTSVKTQEFEVPPDFHLDWRRYFVGDALKKGHAIIDPRAWNEEMLPELQRLEADLNAQNGPRLIRARGLARLSPWFAFGFTFSEVARYTIEVDQRGSLWRTDVAPSDLHAVETGREHVEGGDAATVAVGISITGSLEADVQSYTIDHRAAANILYLRPNRELGRAVFMSAADVSGFARTAKERMRAFVKEHQATRLMLFYFGPLSGACFLGHQLNAVAREIQIMEDQQPSYAPSFLLT